MLRTSSEEASERKLTIKHMNSVKLQISYLDMDDVVATAVKYFGRIQDEQMLEVDTKMSMELEHCSICAIFYYSFITIELCVHEGHESNLSFFLLSFDDKITY